MHGEDHLPRTRIFLSYDRADRERVARLVTALESAGIDVWWDAAIQAGSAFAQDIERELAAADVIVVIWSATSIRSAWVLDEAGVGRDRGRLAPILFDPVKPPLGFRQLHAIHLTDWPGKDPDAQVSTVVSAIEHIRAGTRPDPRESATASAARPPRRTRPWFVAGLVLIVVTAVAMIGWRVMPRRPSGTPILAVLPFTDLSSDIGHAYFAAGLAEEIQDTLARDKRLKVLGGATARVISDKAGDPAYAREKLGVTRLLEGSVRGGYDSQNPNVKVSVRLIDTTTGLEVWSQSFDRSGVDVVATQEEVASAVATQISGPLSGATTADASMPPPPPEAYQNIVIARQLIRSRQADSLRRARDLASAAIKIAPRYAAAFAARSNAMTQLTQYGGEPASTMLPLARRDAETAIQLDPGEADGYAALSLALWSAGDAARAIEAAQAAIARRPQDAEAHLHLAFFLSGDDQPKRASEAFAATVAIDPLWKVPVGSLIATYADTNEPARAQAVADRYRSISTEPSDVKLIDGVAALSAGHIGHAIRLFDEAIALNPEFTLAIVDRDDARKVLLAPPGPAAEHAAQLGERIWDDPESADNLAAALVAAGLSEQLLRFFEARFGTVARYESSAFAEDRSAVVLALAFARAKRPAEAGALRDFAGGRLKRAEAGGLAPAGASRYWAGLLVEEGDRGGALTRLEKGVVDQWWVVCQGPFWLGDDPTLAPLRGDPRFAAVLQLCRTRLNAERALAGFAPASLN